MSDLEARIARLERSNRQHRVALAATVAVLGLVLTAGFGSQDRLPQNLVVDSINVRSLTASFANIDRGTVNNLSAGGVNANSVDATRIEGRTGLFRSAQVDEITSLIARLREMETNRMAITGRSGAVLADFGEGNYGASLNLRGPKEVTVATFGVEQTGGYVTIGNMAGGKMATMASNRDGGTFFTFSPIGKTLTSLDHTERGDGRVAARTRNGNMVVKLESDPEGKTGKLTGQAQDGFPLVTAESKAGKGRLTLYKELGEVADTLPGKD
jgi:hypothetical protein